jgi:hypothetical protein
MSGVTAGTGISVTHTPGEGSTATVSLNATLDDLSNVSASSPSDGQFLKYVTASSAWVPAAIPTINNLDDVGDVTITSAANGQFLKWNGTAWVNDSIPTINTLDDVGDVTITSAASGDFLKWNGTAWVNDPINLSTDTVGDYVSSLVAGTGVTLTNNSGEGATPTVAIGQAVGTSDSPTFAGGIFTGSSSATLVRITQTGSGNAFVVEDETNPDSTPLVVDATGRVYVGKTTNHQYASQVGSATGTEQSKLQVTQGNITVENSSGLTTNTDSNRGGAIVLSRGSSSTNTVGGPIGNTDEGMYLGHVVFAGSRSNNSSKGAQINSRAEAFATDTGVPAYLSIDTVNTSGTLGERMRVSANGLVGINVSPSAQLHVVNSTAANDALIVRAASSQTGDLTDWQNSSGTTLAKIASDGSAQVAGIELGHATDTTITRVSAGKIAVEGVTVATTTDTRDVLVRFYMEVI